jgi:hypothetical protein
VIVTAESVTALHDVAGKVLVAGSHGGIIAAWYAARAGVRAVILHDAGIGKDEAGIAGLSYLEKLGIAAAAVGHATAAIGEGSDMLARGVISRSNRIAAGLGVHPGLTCRAAALQLSAAPCRAGAPPEYCEGRYELAANVTGMDSIGLAQASDAGKILVIGSHGALHGGRPESALPVDAVFAVFNDAGGEATTRLPTLARRGIAAATVDCMSARIGDCRSMWESGVLSHVNGAAAARVAPGMALRDAVELGYLRRQF